MGSLYFIFYYSIQTGSSSFYCLHLNLESHHLTFEVIGGGVVIGDFEVKMDVKQVRSQNV